MGKEIIHDFRPGNLKWGWNGLDFKANEDRKTANMLGIGKGIKKGHYLAITQSNIDYGYLVEEIKYESNPEDMFNAKLRIVGLIED